MFIFHCSLGQFRATSAGYWNANISELISYQEWESESGANQITFSQSCADYKLIHTVIYEKKVNPSLNRGCALNSRSTTVTILKDNLYMKSEKLFFKLIWQRDLLFTYLCIYLLLLVCTFTGDQTCDFGILGWCSHQVSYMAMAKGNGFLSSRLPLRNIHC